METGPFHIARITIPSPGHNFAENETHDATRRLFFPDVDRHRLFPEQCNTG